VSHAPISRANRASRANRPSRTCRTSRTVQGAWTVPSVHGLRSALTAIGLIALTATTTACSGVSGGGTPQQDPKGTLEVWVREPPDAGGELVQAIGAAFTKRTGIPVRTVSIPEGFETKLQQATAQRNLPDIVINDTDQVGQFATQGIVRKIDRAQIDRRVPIDDRSWAAARTHDGAYYGIPFSAQSQAFLVRADWRRRLDRPVPRTWDDITALAKAFTTDDPDGNGKDDTAGLVAPLSSKRGYASWFAATFVWSWGGDYIRDTGGGKYRPDVTSPATVTAVTRLRDMVCRDKVVQPGAANADSTVALETFVAGKAGIYLTGPYVLARIDERLGKDAYEVVPVPKGEGGAVTLAEGENVYLMAGSANQSGQLAYAAFAAGPEAQRIGLGVGAVKPVVRLPVNPSVDAAAVRKDPRWDVFDKAYANAGRYFPRVPNWTPIRQVSAETINALAADCGLDVRTELGRLNARIAGELRDQKVLAE
jgi:multiple sugar transport system substrate-binding protein